MVVGLGLATAIFREPPLRATNLAEKRILEMASYPVGSAENPAPVGTTMSDSLLSMTVAQGNDDNTTHELSVEVRIENVRTAAPQRNRSGTAADSCGCLELGR